MNNKPKKDGGALYKNRRKTEDKHPDMSGTVTVEGKLFDVSGWWTTPASGGEPFLGISIRVAREWVAERVAAADEAKTTKPIHIKGSEYIGM